MTLMCLCEIWIILSIHQKNDGIIYCKTDIRHLDDQCLKCRFCAKWCNRSVKKKKKEFDGNFVVL